MSEQQDVSCPDPNEVVTRSILQEVLADYPTKEDLRRELERFATKDDLAKLDNKVEHYFGGLFERLVGLEALVRTTIVRTVSVELARHAPAISEEARDWMKVVDEKYADLPGRVARLEAQSDE